MFRESEFTPSTEHCVHPERWHADDGDSAEHEVSDLVAAFVTALQPDYVIETGTAWGQTAEKIGKALQTNGQGWLTTLEPDLERARFSADRCYGLPVTVLPIASLDFSPEVEIGFAWFDSLLHLRVVEFMKYLPKMTTKTIVGFHDMSPRHGIKPAVDSLAEQGWITPIYLPTPRGVCFAQVRKTA